MSHYNEQREREMLEDLTPPNNQSAEQAVLGALIKDNKLHDEVFALLSEDDFYFHINQDVYQAVRQCVADNKPADAVTVASYGVDLSYCVELVKNCPASANVLVYAQSVKDKSIQRKVIGACYQIQEDAYISENVLNLLSGAQKALGDVSDQVRKKTRDTSAEAALHDTYKHMKRLVESDGRLMGISTGIESLDLRLNGLKKGTMVVLAARPAMGKTTLALNMVECEAIKGGFPLVFSIEMPREQLMQKMLSSNGNISMNNLMYPKSMSDYQWQGLSDAMARLKSTKLEIIDDGTMTVDLIRYECRRYVKQHGNLTLVCVDYLQLIDGGKSENRTQEISKISRGLKALSKEFNCPFLVLSQLSRSVEQRGNKRPISSDLRESGQIEQDAEEIIFIYRDEVYDENSQDKGLAEVIVNKSRMGKPGTCITEFKGEFSRFEQSNRTTAQPENKAKRFDL